MQEPPNLAQAASLAPGITPLYADAAEMMVDVITPSGEQLPIDDPTLLHLLGNGIVDTQHLRLLRSEHRTLSDCRPVSLISLQTLTQLSEDLRMPLDQRRFRANLYVDWEGGWREENLVNRSLRIGSQAVLAILERDPRCKMITLDPDTSVANPKVLQRVAKAHQGQAGVYGAVLVEGTLQRGDEIELLD